MAFQALSQANMARVEVMPPKFRPSGCEEAVSTNVGGSTAFPIMLGVADRGSNVWSSGSFGFLLPFGLLVPS